MVIFKMDVFNYVIDIIYNTAYMYPYPFTTYLLHICYCGCYKIGKTYASLNKIENKYI